MAANPSIQLGTDGNWAIKEDNLLAYKQDGTRFFNKEFDFSRGSLATFIDKDGLIKVSGVTNTELVTNGTFDSDYDWVVGSSWTISGGSANSDGTTSNLDQACLVANKKYKVTITVSNITTGTLAVRLGGSNADVLSLTENGTYTGYGLSNGSVFRLRSQSGFDGSVDNVSVVEIQTDVPRIDFKDDATGHLLLEPQSTNLITYSEDFSLLDERNNAVVTNNVTVSPSGLLNADEITFDGTSDGRVQASFSSTNGQSYTISVYLKNKDLSDVTQVWIGFSASGQGQFVTITDEWQRYDVTSVANGTIEYPRVQFTGTGSLYAWGFQVEQLQYATSYIPTSGSTVTRNAEVCNNSGSAQDFNLEEGVLYAEIAALTNDGTNRQISLSDGSSGTNKVSLIYTPTSNQLQAFVRSSGSIAFNVSEILSDTTEFNKIALKYKQNDFALWINGIEVDTDTSGNALSGLNVLDFDSADGTLNFYGKTKNLKVFKQAMSDGELYLLTVTQYQSYQEMATALNYTL